MTEPKLQDLQAEAARLATVAKDAADRATAARISLEQRRAPIQQLLRVRRSKLELLHVNIDRMAEGVRRVYQLRDVFRGFFASRMAGDITELVPDQATLHAEACLPLYRAELARLEAEIFSLEAEIKTACRSEGMPDMIEPDFGIVLPWRNIVPQSL